MDNSIKDQVQLVVSHLEGCSGNFLTRLYADYDLDDQSTFRVDMGPKHPKVLFIDGRPNLEFEIGQLDGHIAVVTHNFDQQLLTTTFPKAKIIQIYPYNKVGNVLWNISHKKLTRTLPNVIDNHLIQIVEWKKYLDNIIPTNGCIDYADLNNQNFIECLLGIKLSDSQLKFFNDYQSQQLPYKLDWPNRVCSIQELINQWAINDWFNAWSIAFTIGVFEDINGYRESQRLWSIDQQQFYSWDDVVKIESQYQSLSD